MFERKSFFLLVLLLKFESLAGVPKPPTTAAASPAPNAPSCDASDLMRSSV